MGLLNGEKPRGALPRRKVMAGTSLTLAAALMASSPGWLPTRSALEALDTWPFLSPVEKDLARSAVSDLKAGRWMEAMVKNDKLLPLAPPEAFRTPPSLPVIEITPAGQQRSAGAPRAVDGWRWKLESAWLAVYARNWEAAGRRFVLLAAENSSFAARSLEREAFVRARQGRFRDAAECLSEAGTLSPAVDRVYALAASGGAQDWAELSRMARSGEGASVNNLPSASPRATLSGPIGRGVTPSRPLPPAVPLPERPTMPEAPRSARVEAALILAEAWAQAGPAEKELKWTKDPSRVSRARTYINAVLAQGEAFPHHRQAARAILKLLAGA